VGFRGECSSGTHNSLAGRNPNHESRVETGPYRLCFVVIGVMILAGLAYVVYAERAPPGQPENDPLYPYARRFAMHLGRRIADNFWLDRR